MRWEVKPQGPVNIVAHIVDFDAAPDEAAANFDGFCQPLSRLIQTRRNRPHG